MNVIITDLSYYFAKFIYILKSVNKSVVKIFFQRDFNVPIKVSEAKFYFAFVLTIALAFPRSTVVFFVWESLVLRFLVNAFFYVNSKVLSRTDASGML